MLPQIIPYLVASGKVVSVCLLASAEQPFESLFCSRQAVSRLSSITPLPLPSVNPSIRGSCSVALRYQLGHAGVSAYTKHYCRETQQACFEFYAAFWMKYSLVGCAPASKDLHQVITSSFLDIFVAMMYGSVVLPVYAWA